MQPFAPRPIHFRDIVVHDDWRLKRYTITTRAAAGDDDGGAWPDFAPGRALVFDALPSPACTAVRPGAGFVVEHRGAGADYLVLGWWDRENELPVRVVVREQRPGAAWRPAAATESFCVWDLQVIAFERDAYVATVLAADAAADAVDAYLAVHLVVEMPAATRPPTASHPAGVR